MWSGTIATIPAGYVLCDGTNGTPDLRDRFVVAGRQDHAGVVKTQITGPLTVSGGNTSHTHGLGIRDDGGVDGETSGDTDISDSGTHVPPYYALAYIMKT